MIPVSILDVAVPDPEKDHRVLILTDEEERRLLAIWIGPYEAENIALNLQKTEVSRPSTYSLMAGLLDKGGVKVESVAVSALEKECFYATIEARNGGDPFAVDARPSDAIALALYAGSPIFVAEEVMDRAGEEIPGDMEVAARGKGLEEVLKAGVPAESREEREEREARQSRSAEERREESRQKLLAYLARAGELGRREAGADE